MKEELVKEKREELTALQKMAIYILIYAFLGWILETVFCLVTTGEFTKRGFLYGPLCPMYGFAAVIMIDILKKVKTNTIGKFVICMIAFTVFEYIVSLVLEDIFGLRWWDYSNEVFNIHGRVSLAYSIAWGILGTIFVEKIHPYIKKKIEPLIIKISNKFRYIILGALYLVILVDFILSIIKYINI